MTDNIPELPAAYEPVEIDEAPDIRTAASELAARGCPEGTLVWLRRQTLAADRGGEAWHGHAGDLHCSVILQPEFEETRYGELFLVASVSMGNALATHLSPMTALGYCWPNRVMIADHALCGIWLDCGTSPHNWLAVSCSVNLLESPENLPSAISVREAEGTTDLTAAILLQGFSRQFITVINAWSDSGTQAIVEKWKIRGNRPGDRLVLAGIDGTITGLDSWGNLHLETAAGEAIRLDINTFVRRTGVTKKHSDGKDDRRSEVA